MTHEPIPTSPPRRRPAPPPQAQPGRRRPLRERLTHPRISPPHITPKGKVALAWTGAILALIAVAIAVLVAVWDWNWFRGPVERLASARMHRQVSIAGDLNANIWSWQPSVTADRIAIANPPWAGAGKLGTIDRLAVQIRLLPLFSGHTDLRLLRLERPSFDLLADAQGRKNWDFSDGRVQQPMKLPPIRRFLIHEGRLTYLDKRRAVRFEGTINALETYGAVNRGFELLGHGVINGAAFRAAVTGGPLLNIDRSRPYPFDVDIHAGATAITAKGAVPKPFDLGHFHMATTARGPDMADLFPLTGVALPNTPPYRLRGQLVRDGLVWRIDDLGGRFGDSDLAGRLSVTTGRKRPLLKADLASRSLDFDDLGAVFGAAPKIGRGETASPKEVAMARTMIAEKRMFSDAPLDVNRIRAMDADVTYKARSIRDAPSSLSAGAVHVKLDDGLLRADPVTLTMPRGQVSGHVELNARNATPATDLDLRLTNARIEQVAPVKFDGAPPITGALVGRAQISGTGASVHRTLASANGQVVVVATGGQINKGMAELLGVNVFKGLGLLHKKDTTDVRCAVARFDTRGGVMRASDIVFDTGPVLVTGKGEINLGSERMDLRVKGHDKKFRFAHVLLPIRATGPLMAPKVGVEPGGAIAQGGAALTLGSLLSPLAAILPFVDPGLAKDADCGALIAQAGAQGAPVKTAASTPLTAKR